MTKAAAELARRVPAGATLRLQLVQCGKPHCKKWHGPYWYAFWKVNGKTRSAYVGSRERLVAMLEARSHDHARAEQLAAMYERTAPPPEARVPRRGRMRVSQKGARKTPARSPAPRARQRGSSR